MKYVRLVSAALLAVPSIVFGGNYFLRLFRLPALGASTGGQLLQAMRDGRLMAAIALSHVVAGGLLVLPRTRVLGALLQLPMTIGMAAFHATMLPAGLGMAAVLLLLNLAALWDGPRLRSLLASAPARRVALDGHPHW